MFTSKRRRNGYSSLILATKNMYLLVILMLLFFTTAPSWAVTYSYTELLPPGWIESDAFDINNKGAVVGRGDDGTTTWKAFIYIGGMYTEPLPPEVTWSEAHGINDNGEVVGSFYDGTTSKGFIFSGGAYISLLPPGWVSAEASDINNNGTVIGNGYDGTTVKGFIYSGGVYIEVVPPPGLTGLSFSRINNIGDIVGSDDHGSNGFIYSGGTYTMLLPPTWTLARASGINDNGVVAGGGFDITGNKRGFVYSGGTYTTLLGAPFLGYYLESLSINDNGDVVGEGGVHVSKGFIYNGGFYTELLPPGSIQSVARSIDNNGAVVGSAGYGAIDFYISKAFIATPSAIVAVGNLQAAIALLSQNAFKNTNMQNALNNKLNTVIQNISAGNYADALNQLQKDVLSKTDGCATTGVADKNDWITNCTDQAEVYPLVVEAIRIVRNMM